MSRKFSVRRTRSCSFSTITNKMNGVDVTLCRRRGSEDNTRLEDTQIELRGIIQQNAGLSHQTNRESSYSSQHVEPGDVKDLQDKRRLVIQELNETEQIYVQHLDYTVELIRQLQMLNVPEGLKGKEKILFGNFNELFEFHKRKLLPELKACEDNIDKLALTFTKYKKHFTMYVTYCENKPRSEFLLSTYDYPEMKALLQERHFTITDLLIRPVQRIMKYHLLLDTILKYTINCGESTEALKEAITVMKEIPLTASNMMEVGRLHSFEHNLQRHGTLLIQGDLCVDEGGNNNSFTKRYRIRHTYLFEKVIIFSAKKESATIGYYYECKITIKLPDLCMKEFESEDETVFLLTDTRLRKTYRVKANDKSQKTEWANKIRKLLDCQNDLILQLQFPITQSKG